MLVVEYLWFLQINWSFSTCTLAEQATLWLLTRRKCLRVFPHWAGYFPLFVQVKELNHYLEAEKSCRTDLEMYVAVLNTQKSVLQEDAEKLRKELHEGIYLIIVLWVSSISMQNPMELLFLLSLLPWTWLKEIGRGKQHSWMWKALKCLQKSWIWSSLMTEKQWSHSFPQGLLLNIC